jgi:HAMP domain-containing protein
VFIWTVSDFIGLGFMALFAVIALALFVWAAVQRAVARIRDTFRNFRSRRNG